MRRAYRRSFIQRAPSVPAPSIDFLFFDVPQPCVYGHAIELDAQPLRQPACRLEDVRAKNPTLDSSTLATCLRTVSK